METQKFKGDEVELKIEAVAKPAFDQTSLALDEFYAGGYDSNPFLLMLYDDKRVPFAERINKTAFVEFIKETLRRFPFIGSFDTYLFVLRAIFGSDSEIFFEVPGPGHLEVNVNATSSLDFEFYYREGDGSTGEMTDSEGNILVFRGISGIETEYELELLFSEIIPAGITPQVSLTFFARYAFVAEDDIGDLSPIIDHEGNQIIFVEIGT